MRIALVTETFLPKVDGIVNTLCKLMEYLGESGHESILVAPKGAPFIYKNTRILPAAAIPIPFYPELKLVQPWTNIAHDLDPFKPDIVHVLNPVSIGLAGINYARSRHIPLIASYHTDIPGFAARWGFPIFSELIWKYLRWLHNRADLNLCPSHATQNELRAQRIQRVKIWSRGVDTVLFNPKKRSTDWRRRLSRGSIQSPLLLYVGRLSPEKRIDWLLPLLQKIPEARLAIVGDGPIRMSLESKFANTPTVFTGYLRGENLASAYASADIFVFPAANETFGNVILEAMSSGLPVIAPRSGGVTDSIIDRCSGYLFEPEDHSAMVYSVRRLLDHPNIASQMRKIAREEACNRSWSEVMEGLIEEYRHVIQNYQLLNQPDILRAPLPSQNYLP